MASKIKIIPQFGLLEDSSKLLIEIDSIVNKNGVNIKIENATHNIIVDTIILEKGVSQLVREVNLQIPEDSSQSAISVFVSIEEKQDDESYLLKQVLPSIFYIKDKIDSSFSGMLQVTPSFIGVNDICVLNLECEPNSRFLISINDRQFNIFTNLLLIIFQNNILQVLI